MKSSARLVVSSYLLMLGSSAALFAAVVTADGLPKVESRPARAGAKELPKYGPTAALEFAGGYKGEAFTANTLYCYPDAVGVPFGDCENIIPMTPTLWTPKQIKADFDRRMAALPVNERKKGIIVMLKTERCAPKSLRACTVTTAALEKRATPLAADFLIYGALLKPRDKERDSFELAGTIEIETGVDAWKNGAAGEYKFKQGPGATLAFLDPADGKFLDRTDASLLKLSERDFQKNQGQTPVLHAKLADMLAKIGKPPSE
jgi:hypothetical protein